MNEKHRGRRHRRHRFGGEAGFPFPGPPFGHHAGRRMHGAHKARRGDIRTAALLLLAEEPRNGYQIMQELETRSAGVWRPSPGSVYPTLQQLEDEALVRSDEIDGRRVLRLTETGLAQLEKRPKDAPAPWEAMASGVSDQAHELGSLVRQVGLAAMQVVDAGNESQVVEASGILETSRRALYRILAGDDTGGDREENEGS